MFGLRYLSHRSRRPEASRAGRGPHTAFPLVALCGALLVPAAAHAGFEYVVPPAPIPTPIPAVALSAPHHDAGVTGFGRDLPLADAVRQLVPPTVPVVYASEVDRTRRITWRGQGRPWRDVLSDALAPTGYVAAHDGSALIIAAGSGVLPSGHIDRVALPAPGAATTTTSPARPTTPQTGTSREPIRLRPVAAPAASQESHSAIQPTAPIPAPLPAPGGDAAVPQTVPQAAPSAGASDQPPAPIMVAAAAHPTPLTPAAPVQPHMANRAVTVPSPGSAAADAATGPVAPAPVAPPAPEALVPLTADDPRTARTWAIAPGRTAHETIRDWTQSLGFPPPAWRIEYQYPIEAPGSYTGTLYGAVKYLFSGFYQAPVQPDWRFHENNLLVVRPAGN